LTLALPCPPAKDNWTSSHVQKKATNASPTGILYVKVPKTGSSTGSSVNLRLASRIYQKVVGAASTPSSSEEEEVGGNRTRSASPQIHLGVCRNRFQHSSAFRLGYGRWNRTRSVLWSVVRDPTDRFVSEYFHFFVSRGRRNASDDAVLRKYLWRSRKALPSFQVRYLALVPLAAAGDDVTDEELTEERRVWRRPDSSPRQAPPTPSPSPPTTLAPSQAPHPAVSVETIRSILRGYDFVGVSERMDESLVALQLLLGLDTADIVHMRYAHYGARAAAAATGSRMHVVVGPAGAPA
jgi:Sulfotransferase family